MKSLQGGIFVSEMIVVHGIEGWTDVITDALDMDYMKKKKHVPNTPQAVKVCHLITFKCTQKLFSTN